MVKMRETAMETLGDRYDPVQFHKFILDMDGASFRVMEPYLKHGCSPAERSKAANGP